MNHFSPFFCATSLLLVALAPAQVERQVSLFGGYNSTQIPRSEDPRRGAGVGLAFLKPEPRLSRRGLRGRIRYEIYYLGSTSPGPFEFDPDRTDAFGTFAALRIERARLFADIGFGVQYASQPSYDIPLQFNTTPTATIGYRFALPRSRALEFGVRYLHVSNGGRKPPNGGQNWLLASVSVAF